MKITLNDKNEITGYVRVGDLENGIEIKDRDFGDLVDNNGYFNYKYQSGRVYKVNNSNKLDVHSVTSEIEMLHSDLNTSDYVILKAVEQLLIDSGNNDLKEVINDRMIKRKRLNDLEKKLNGRA